MFITEEHYNDGVVEVYRQPAKSFPEATQLLMIDVRDTLSTAFAAEVMEKWFTAYQASESGPITVEMVDQGTTHKFSYIP